MGTEVYENEPGAVRCIQFYCVDAATTICKYYIDKGNGISGIDIKKQCIYGDDLQALGNISICLSGNC
jgi:hypothetical protein